VDVLDLRSDTVTRPTPAMRRAMADAEVGDDVYGEDPSVRRLEEESAALLGKQAAVFVPSGTMANQIALRLLTRPGEVVLAGRDAHVLRWEGGAAAALWGLQIECIGGGGFFDPADVEAALPPAPDDPHLARVSALCVEDTHNASGGRVWPTERLESVAAAAHARGLGLHLDGARLWNAVAARGADGDAVRLARPFHTVSFCLSKGLGAPVGSLLCTDAERAGEARRVRKLLGGGMRQAGVLAAAGLHALHHHRERLAEDHEHARRLAGGLAGLGLEVEGEPETNMVFFRVPDPRSFLRSARRAGVLLGPADRHRVRAVTHLDVDAAGVDEALRRLARASAQG